MNMVIGYWFSFAFKWKAHIKWWYFDSSQIRIKTKHSLVFTIAQDLFSKQKGYLEEELDYRKQALDQAYMVGKEQ